AAAHRAAELGPGDLAVRRPSPRGGCRPRGGEAPHPRPAGGGRQHTRCGRAHRAVARRRLHPLDRERGQSLAGGGGGGYRRTTDMSPRKIWAIAWKELIQAARDPLSLAMLLGVPTMMLLLYGYALSFNVRHIRLAVQDLDKSAASRNLVSAFVNNEYFTQVADLPAGADLERLTERRQAKAILVIPEGTADRLAKGRPAPVQLLVDGADANTASSVMGYAAAIVAAANASIQAERVAEAGGRVELAPLVYEPRVWYNPELDSTHFLVPGLIGFILMLTAVLSTALSVVREKERGTMEQLRVTSLKPGELIVGKILPYLGISLAATALIL